MISSGLIKIIQDIMRQDDGVDGDAQRLSQLVWMIFLKILDDNEQELEQLNGSYSPAVPKNLQWRNWAANEEGLTGDSLLQFINNDLFPNLRKLSTNLENSRTQIVREVFEDSHNYMKNGTLLRQVVNKINTIDFNKQTDRHSFNDIYETLLKSLQSAGNSGEYYTPRPVTQFIVEMIDPQFGEKILDPACGTGGFLANAIDHIRKQVKTPEDERVLQDSIRGVEKKQLPHLLCMTNMILHGIEVPIQIRRDNTLKRPLKDYGPADRVDVILTNPPFGGTEEPGIESNFPQTFRTRETADLFLVLIMKLLKEGGRAGLVLPDGTLFGEGVKTRIKQELLENCNLHTIVRLPKTVFSPYTDIATNLLFFTKGSRTNDVWFYELQLPEGYKAYSKTKPIKHAEFDPIKDWWNDRVENDNAWKVPIADIEANNFNLDFKNPSKIVEDEDVDPDQLISEINESFEYSSKLLNKIQESLK
jgi:type I restriction enzyme M protein